MTFVVDSSVALKWVLTEQDSAKAIKLRLDYRAGTHDLISPDILLVESAHALARAERRRIIPLASADAYLLDIISTAPTSHAHLPLLRRALAIASAERVGVYDCLYVALAEQELCEFITADDKLIRNLQPKFPFIRSLASLP